MAIEHYKKHKEQLLKLHELIALGKGDSAEAELLCEEMDVSGRGLSNSERNRIGGLSADLYMLTGDEIKESATGSFNESEFGAALDENDADGILKMLRQENCRKPEHVVACLRGWCWRIAKDYDVSLKFFEFAMKLEPTNVKYAVMVALRKMDLEIQLNPKEKNILVQFYPKEASRAAITNPVQKFDFETATEKALLQIA